MSPRTRSALDRLLAVAVQEVQCGWSSEGLTPCERDWAGTALQACLEAWLSECSDAALQHALDVLSEARHRDLPVHLLFQALSRLPDRLRSIGGADAPELALAVIELDQFVRRLLCEGGSLLWAYQRRQRSNLQAQSREIGALLTLARDSSRLKDLEELPRVVLMRNARAFGCDRAIAWHHDSVQGLSCIASYVAEHATASQCVWIPQADRLATEAIEQRRPLWKNERECGGASIHLPLISADAVIGAVSLYRSGPDASFHKRDLLLANSLSSISALLLSNAQLVTAYRKREERAARLANLTEELSGVRPFTAVLEKAADFLREILVPDGMASIKLRRREPIECLHAEAISYRHPHWTPTAEACRTLCMAMDTEPYATLERLREPVVLSDLSRYPVAGRRLSEVTGAGSAILLPLLEDSQVIGALELLSAQPDSFRNADMALARSVAERISAVLLSSRLLEETERHAREIETLFEAAKDISRMRPELEGVMDRLLQRSLGVLRADMGFVALLQGDQGKLPAAVLPDGVRLPHVFPISPETSVLVSLLRQSNAVQIADPGHLDPREYPLMSTLAAGSILLVPMLLDDQIIGGMVLACREARTFDESERNLALSLAYLGSLAVRNASYFATLEREVNNRTRALEEANKKLRMLDQVRRNLLSNVTHELRTPLSGILGYGEILEEELSNQFSDEQRAFMHQLLSEGYHLRDLINTMLDMSQLATGTLELDRQPVSFQLLARQACDQYQKLAEPKGIRFECDCEEELPYVFADPSRAYQVLGHLLTNALKFTPYGGGVSLRIATVQDDRPMVRVEVSDTGIGIEPDKLPMLFTSFYQADPTATRQFGGMGLGLSLSKSLIELHGGQIWAQSTPGHGSTFGFTLPVWRESDESSASGNG